MLRSPLAFLLCVGALGLAILGLGAYFGAALGGALILEALALRVERRPLEKPEYQRPPAPIEGDANV